MKIVFNVKYIYASLAQLVRATDCIVVRQHYFKKQQIYVPQSALEGRVNSKVGGWNPSIDPNQ